MAKKIVLFLSTFKSRAEEDGPQNYRCPDGSTVQGIQTNEAPVRWLLRKYPDADELLCVLTPAAKEKAWEKFQKRIGAEHPAVNFFPVDWDDSEPFEKQALGALLSRIGPGDQILLETTGGLRNTVMDLLLLARITEYVNARTLCAVYSNLKRKEVQDITPILRRFDLVSGMQELTSFGSVRTLKQYYRGVTPEKPVKDLLDAVQDLTETVQLCRVDRMDRAMQRFNDAMTAAEQCSDPMMKLLLPAFRAKFEGGLNLPNLIQWCVDSDLLQQALTIYREKLPAYVLQSPRHLVSWPDTQAPDCWSNPDKEKYVTHNAITDRFTQDLSGMVFGLLYCQTIEEAENRFEKLLERSYFQVPWQHQQKLLNILNDYQYIRVLRNLVNHAAEDGETVTKGLLPYLDMCGYDIYQKDSATPLDDVTADMVRRALHDAARRRRYI